MFITTTTLLLLSTIANPFSLDNFHRYHDRSCLHRSGKQWQQEVQVHPVSVTTTATATRRRSSISSDHASTSEEQPEIHPSSSSSSAPPSSSLLSKEQRSTFHHEVPLPNSYYTQILSNDNSLQGVATKLRQYYDQHFCDPRQPNANRFIWDPWFVQVGDTLKHLKKSSETVGEGETGVLDGEEEATNEQVQYSLKRIQSSTFFTSPTEQDNAHNKNDEEELTLFDDLVNELTTLGRSIGLTAITPPWMSLYMDGDRQNLHTDAPQGQMAFVLSLCRDDNYVKNGSNDFSGGETMLLRSDILDYWKGFDGSKGLECGDIMRFVPPSPLGRCIVFDPRIPHGVNTVDGTLDPRKGRVVIHGWYNEPEVCFFGPWQKRDSDIDHDNVYYDNDDPATRGANQILEDSFQPLLQTLSSGEIGRVMGYLAIQLEIDEYGEVDNVLAVCDTLRADWDDYRGVIGYDEAERPVMEDAVSDVRLTIYETLKNLHFGDGEPGRVIVVPFAFE